MSSIGMVLDIATTALNAQQYSMSVTAHNIANVNTDGYSRQTPILATKDSQISDGLIMGRGVETGQVLRVFDQFIENQLMDEKSDMLLSQEMEKYMQILEGVFSENSDAGISDMLSGFWNSWHDISNNPSGAPERIALYEQSQLLTEQFNALSLDLTQIERDLTVAVSAGVDKINEITKEIAHLNDQILGMETNNSIANDLRDKRNVLVSELSGYIDVTTYEQDNGSLSVMSAKSCTLVYGVTNYELELGGANGDRVLWQDSSGAYLDVTDHITKGKLGGWLEMRDEVVEKYKRDLDAVVKELAWSVNVQHSQGVGLESFSTITGTYQASSTSAAIDSSGISFADRINDGSFKLWFYDSNGNYVSDTTLTIDADVTSIDDMVTAIKAIDPAMISGTTVDGMLQINGVNGYTFAFSDDTSNVLAALGINTYFNSNGAGNLSINDTIGLNKGVIAAAKIANNGDFTSGDNTNALSMTDIQYTSQQISQWTCDRADGNKEGTVNATIEEYFHSMLGSMGILSSSISRGREFSEMMMNNLSQIRESVSGVSLDEEMTNLIKFQHAYAAATKLIGVSDEMLTTLLELK